MASSEDTLTIQNCPMCGKGHKYQLEIHRTLSMSFITPNNTGNSNRTRKHFIRLFTCPKTDKDFEVLFWLEETSNAVILSVDIKGLAKERVDDEN